MSEAPDSKDGAEPGASTDGPSDAVPERAEQPAEPDRVDDVDASEQRAALDADGRERPKFLLDFPSHPELERLMAAFEAGNFALVRKDAPALIDSADDPEVRRAAAELRRRIDPDPLLKALLLIAILLFAGLVSWSYLR